MVHAGALGSAGGNQGCQWGVMTQVEILITVKTYPVLTGHGEAACIAGLQRRADGSLGWGRLFPVPFRELEDTAKFRMWQWVTVQAHRTTKDIRPETWVPDADTIVPGEQIDTDRGTWRRRMDVLEPLLVESMCEVQERQAADGTSLGGFTLDPAKVLDIYAEPNDEWSPKTKARSQQTSLFHPDLPPLEWVPWRFKIRYRCGPDCSGHNQGAYDWGLMELYRKQRRTKGDVGARDDAVEKLRTIVSEANDPVLFVGSQHRWMDRFLVIGWAHPRRGSQGDSDQLRLEIL